MGPARAVRSITHHQAVGELAMFKFPTIEITGAKGKTSTCHLLSFLLSRDGTRVLSLTSSGLAACGPGARSLEEKVSIAPATLLRLSKERLDFDLGVLEVSLGGSGLAKVGVITGLQEDYPIAAGTRRARDGKGQMIRSAKGNLVYPAEESDIWGPMVPRGAEVVTFGPDGDVQVRLEPGALGGPSTLHVRADDRKTSLVLGHGYFHPAYVTAYGCSLAVIMALGQDTFAAASLLSDFPGVPGRGEVKVGPQGTVVRERNPGVSAGSLAFLLRSLVDDYGCRDIGLLLDPVNTKVCEKLDLGAVRRLCRDIPQVRGLYLTPCGRSLAQEGMEMVEGTDDLKGRHEVLLWATKEGYL
jgi:hypothetical protein